MKKNIITAFMLIGLFSLTNAQVGINQPAPKATLDIEKSANAASPDGLLLPRLTVAELTAKTYGADQHGALVFITDEAGIAGAGKGTYYYDSLLTKWVSMNIGNDNSFTPKPVTIPLTVSAINWKSYLTYNYFEFTTGVVNRLTFPEAKDFSGRTIYLKNSTSGNINYDAIPPELQPDPGPGTPFTMMPRTGAQRLYSDGTKWYLMGGKSA